MLQSTGVHESRERYHVQTAVLRIAHQRQSEFVRGLRTRTTRMEQAARNVVDVSFGHKLNRPFDGWTEGFYSSTVVRCGAPSVANLELELPDESDRYARPRDCYQLGQLLSIGGMHVCGQFYEPRLS